FDQVALREREDEVTVRDIDLSPAESLGVDPLLHSTNHLLRITFASEQNRVGHARHGSTLKTLTSTVTCSFYVKVTTTHAVLHVANQSAVLDQGVTLRLHSF